MSSYPPAGGEPERAPLLYAVGIACAALGVVFGVVSMVSAYNTSAKLGGAPTAELYVSGATLALGLVMLALWLWRRFGALLADNGAGYPQYDSSLYTQGYGPRYGASGQPPQGSFAPQQGYGGAGQGTFGDRFMPQRPAAPAPLFSAEDLAQAQQQGPALDDGSPFAADPLFAPDPTGPNVRRFVFPKDDLGLCEDSNAIDANRKVYVVADGVGQSFMPAPWARIIARGYMRKPSAFNDQKEFDTWLAALSDEWRAWMRDTWMATLKEQRAHAGATPELIATLEEGWNRDLEQKGAQTTLVGCSLVKDKARRGGVIAQCFAIGDSDCLHFRRDVNGSWRLVKAFPLERPEDFNLTPVTLPTRREPRLVEGVWTRRQAIQLPVARGDLIVLGSDAVTKWLLTQALLAAAAPITSDSAPQTGLSVGDIADADTLTPSETFMAGRERDERGPNFSASQAKPSPRAPDWATVLSQRDPATVKALVHREFEAGRMDRDDVTLLVIEIP